MDKTLARRVFNDYTARYHVNEVEVALKIAHTYRVADIAERIALSLDLSESDVTFAWFLGLLHDFGRFEQWRRFGTYVDRDSVDHAELGADILFLEGKIDDFTVDGVPGDWRATAETAIRLHNKLVLPDGLDERTALFSNLLRDADKCDIFRVVTEPPFDERNERIASGARAAREDVITCIREHRCVPRTISKRTEFETLLSQCCMGFELCFDESKKITKEQGYLEQLLNIPVTDEKAAMQLAFAREEIMRN